MLRIPSVLVACALALATVGAARAEPIALDTPVSGSIVDPAVADSYTFDVAPGRVVFVDRTATSNRTGLNWILADVHGRVLAQDLSNLDDLGPVRLMGGSYTITVRSESTGVGTYGFTAWDATEQRMAAVPGDRIVGAIDKPGGRLFVDITVDEPTRLFVDVVAATNGGSMRRYLYDAADHMLSAESTSLVDIGVHALVPGVYRLLIDGELDAVGTFTIDLVPVVDFHGTLALGDVLDTAIAQPGQERHYTVAIPSGTRAALDYIASSDRFVVHWRLTDPAGLEVVPWTTGLDNGVVRPYVGGDYTLSFRGEGGAVPTFRIALAPVVDGATAIALDQAVTGAITILGQVQRYTFSVDPGEVVALDVTSAPAASSMGAALVDAQGRTILGKTGSLADVAGVALAGGDYTLEISGDTGTVGTYAFTLRTVTHVAQAVTLGTSVSGAIALPGQRGDYTFTLATPRLVTLDVTAVTNGSDLNSVLVDAHGRTLLARSTSLADRAPVALMAGTHTLSILGEGAALGTYTFTLVDAGATTWTPPAGDPVTLGVDVAGSIAVAAEVDTYRLDLASDTRVYVDLLTGATGLTWTLTDPAGGVVFGPTAATTPTTQDQGPVTLAAGAYTLTLTHPTAAVGAYGFRVSAVTDAAGEVVIDAPLSGAILVPGAVNRYTLEVPDGGGGQELYFDLTTGATGLTWTLVDPAGLSVFSGAASALGTDDRGPLSLAGGTYTLSFQASAGATPVFGATVRAVVDGSTPIALDEDVAGVIPSIGGVAAHTFTLAEDTRVFLDLTTGASGLGVTLVDPAGREILSAASAASAADDDRGPYDLQPGSYTLVFDHANDDLAAYGFVLRKGQDVVMPLAVGEVASGTIGPADRHVHELTIVDAPARVYLRSVSGANVVRTIEDAQGRVIVADDAGDFGPRTLQPGVYRITSRRTTGAPVAYEWSVLSAEDHDEGVAPWDQVIEGAIAGPGATASYMIVVDEPGTELRFDLMKNSYDLDWSFIDPVGTALFAGASATSFSNHDRGPFVLAAGTYRLVFVPTGASVPPWQLIVRGPPEPPEPPTGCAACSALDIVFVFDTSASMGDDAAAVCGFASSMIAGLEDRGIETRATYWGITNTAAIPCVTSSVAAELGSTVPGDPPPELATLETCDAGGVASENWAPAVAIVADGFDWAPGAVRLVIPMSDEGPHCGAPISATDEVAIDHAGAVARASGVLVSPVVPSYVTDPLEALAQILAQATGGTATIATFTPTELYDIVVQTADDACASAGDEPAVPGVGTSEPADGASVPAGTTLVLSGQAAPVNRFRPLVGVTITREGEPARPVDSVDAAGRFFAVVTVEPGINTFELELVEECGSFAARVTLFGETEEDAGLDAFEDVSHLVAASYRDTTFHRGGNVLFADVIAKNVGDTILEGPLLMVLSGALHPTVTPSAMGRTPDGEPVWEVVPDGVALGSGVSAPPFQLAFADPERVPVRYQARWLAPKNRAPRFASAPLTTATVGVAWAYAPAAEDADGHTLSFALPIAPVGMTVDATTGALAWTPTAGDAGQHDVTLVVADGRGGSAAQRFTLSVAEPGGNRPPVFLTAPPTHAAVGAAYAYDADARDADGDLVVFTLDVAPDGVSIDAELGRVEWPFAVPGRHTLTVSVADGEGGVARQTWALTVGEIADDPHAPVIISTPPVIAAVGALYFYPVVAEDPDGDPLAFTLLQGPAGMTIDPLTGRVGWTPGEADLGPHTVELEVDDGVFGTSGQVWVVMVTDDPPNLAPIFTTTPPFHALVGAPWVYAAAAADPEGQAVTFARVVGPAEVVVDPTSGLASWTPTAPGEVVVGLGASDPHGATGHQVMTVHVRADNAPPTITSAPVTAATVGVAFRYVVIARDADDDPLTFSLTGPAGMAVDAASGAVTWTPVVGDAGVHPVVVTVVDRFGASDEQAFDVTVVQDTIAPTVALTVGRDPACMSRDLSICVAASDDRGVVARALTVDDLPVTLVAGGCGVVTPAASGSLALAATASDAAGNVGEAARALSVIDCDDPEAPTVTLASPAPGVIIESPTEISATIGDNNPANLSWTVSIARAGDEGFTLIASGTGAIDGVLTTFDPTLLPNDDYRVRVEASDGVHTAGVEFDVAVSGELKLGEFSVTLVDLVPIVAGVPMSVTRIYDSLDTRVGDFGAGWRLGIAGGVSDSPVEHPGTDLVSLFATEAFTATTRVYVTRPDGRRVGFTFAPTSAGFLGTVRPAFDPDPGVTDTLTAVGPSVLLNIGGRYLNYILPYNPDTYVLETREKMRYTMTEGGGIIAVEDPAGNTLTIDEAGITSSLGVSIAFERDDAGRIVAVSELDDPDDDVEPGKLLYAYDALGNLVASTDLAGETTTYRYEAPGRPNYLTAIEDPLGRPVVRNVYDEDGRLVASCPPGGDIDTLEGCAQSTFDVAGASETILDANGNRIDRVYDPRGNLLLERRWLDASTPLDTEREYDSEGNVLSRSDALGGTTTYTYDARGNRTSATDPSGATWTRTYDLACDEPVSACDPIGNCMTWTYDDACRVVAMTDAVGGVTALAYDAQGRMIEHRDPGGTAVVLTHDARGVASVTDGAGEVTTLTHDARGNTTRVVDRLGRTQTRVLDAASRVLSETWDTVPPSATTYDYDELGRLVEAADAIATTVYTYRSDGRVEGVETRIAGGPTTTLTYDYDANGNVTGVVDSLGGHTRYDYDALGRLVSARQWGTGVDDKRVDLEYSRADVLVSMTRYADLDGAIPIVVTTFEHACASCPDRLTAIRHRRADDSVIEDLVLERDAARRITKLTDREGAHVIVHDGAARVIAVDHPAAGGLVDERFTYDAAGNRVASHELSAATHVDNRLTAADATTFAYDLRGAMIERVDADSGARATYGYDPSGRLVATALYDGGGAPIATAAQGHSTLDRRMWSEVDGVRRYYVYDGRNPALVLAADGSVVHRRLYLRSVDRVVADEHLGVTRWLLTDHLGTVRDVVDANGAELAHYVYSAFGELTLDTSAGAVVNALGFTAREVDGPEALGHFRARAYDPSLGRFLQEDPLRPWGYDYAAGSPYLMRDPTGRAAASEYAGLIGKVSLVLSVCDFYAGFAMLRGFAALVSYGINYVGEAFETLEQPGPFELPAPIGEWDFVPCVDLVRDLPSIMENAPSYLEDAYDMANDAYQSYER
ncbi:MAG: hypothetical protein IT385_03865 [Deltaproteobacteria bacterium]|nr:hypothetical protein [Deltaproteobacteria bacterium]